MLDRRQLLRLAAGGAVGSLATGSFGCRQARREATAPEPDFTVAFLTDPHVFDDLEADQGFRLAVEHAMAQKRSPEVLITGGDLAMDVLETDREEADRQFDLFDVGLESARIPIHHTIGNHDCFGVYESSGVSEEDPLFGKTYFLQRFGLERAYHSFDHEGWHFVVLDTLKIADRGYSGHVDAEQLAWLEDDLASAARPTVVVGHLPLFSNYIEWRRGTSEGIPASVSVENCHEVAEVLIRHPVKMVLAGHLHIIETFTFKGIEFANLGAVSGNWWRGQRDGFEEGYAILEHRGDEVSWRYVDYGWESPAEETQEAAGA